MSSQLNLYAILDAIGLSATVGDGKLELEGTVEVNNGDISFDVHVTSLLEGIVEVNKSMWVLVKMEDLGCIYRASRGMLQNITLIDLANTECQGYIKSKDMPALLSAMTIPKIKPEWVLDKIKC